MRRAWWVVEEKTDYEIVAFINDEATYFIEPEGLIDAIGEGSYQESSLAIDGYSVVVVGRFCMVVMKGFEMFLELKSRVELCLLDHVVLQGIQRPYLSERNKRWPSRHVLSLSARMDSSAGVDSGINRTLLDCSI